MAFVDRISVQEVRRSLLGGERLLFVCAYEGTGYDRVNLEGSISWEAFEQHLLFMKKDDRVVLYCG